tara:strand:- start:239 stop:466 length:228 start_codon:yes stop_codon:yes gene_type:complete
VVTSEVKLTLIVIIFSITTISVMIGFGEIDFFEGMSCEELKIYVSDIHPDETYPFGTWMTPSQIESLHEQYNQCI